MKNNNENYQHHNHDTGKCVHSHEHNHHEQHNHEESHHGHGSHGHHHHHDFGSNKKKLLLVIFFNSIITIAEYIGGVLSGSLALLSDAGHNLSDVLSLMLGYAGEKVSEKKPTAEYSFGLKRFEVLVALVNSITLVIVGLYIVHEAVMRFIDPQPINLKIMLPIAAIGLLGNLFSIAVLLKNKEANLNMRAAFLHLLYDAISSAAVILGAVIMYFTNLMIVDTVISVIIVIMIFGSSIGIIKESLRIFMQGSPVDIDSLEVKKSITEIKGVAGVHGLHIWSINSNEIFLSCHISLFESVENINDCIIKTVNAMLDSKYKIKHTTLQIENQKICDPAKDNCCR